MRAAALLFAAYGTAVLVNASIQQQQLGWESIEPGGFPRAVLRFIGMAVIAAGLWRRARWAWWAGVVLSCLWGLTGTAGLITLWALRAQDNGYWLPDMPALVLPSILALAVGAVLLLLPSSRRAFRPPAATGVGTPPPDG